MTGGAPTRWQSWVAPPNIATQSGQSKRVGEYSNRTFGGILAEHCFAFFYTLNTGLNF
jgi:hypothetical protein